MFIVFILSFKTFISSVYSIAMPEFATSVTGSVGFLCEGALVSSMNEKDVKPGGDVKD